MSALKKYTYYLVYVAGKGFVGEGNGTFFTNPKEAYFYESRGFADDTSFELGGELVTVRFTTTT